MRPVAGVAGDGELLVAGGAGDAGGPGASLLFPADGAGERDLELGFPCWDLQCTYSCSWDLGTGNTPTFGSLKQSLEGAVWWLLV